MNLAIDCMQIQQSFPPRTHGRKLKNAICDWILGVFWVLSNQYEWNPTWWKHDENHQPIAGEILLDLNLGNENSLKSKQVIGARPIGFEFQVRFHFRIPLRTFAGH